MSKEQGREENNVRDQIEQIADIRKQLARKEKELHIKCNHKNGKGKLKLEAVYGKEGMFKCKKCNQEFSMEKIDTKAGLSAAELLNDMIQQIRCYSDDSVNDVKLCKHLGEVAYNIGEIVDLYDKTVKAVGKKKKEKKNKDHNKGGSYGNYGWDGVSFGGRR